MSLAGQVEFLQEINSPGNVFFQLFGAKKVLVPKICPNMIPLIELVEGNWGQVGCAMTVHYLLDGKEIIVEEKVEAMDEKKQSITYNLSGGDLVKLYKTLKITFQAISKGGKNFLKWTYEYVKLNSDVPTPEKFKDFVTEVTNVIDAHNMQLMKNANTQVNGDELTVY